jgi:hypothetical protein
VRIAYLDFAQLCRSQEKIRTPGSLLGRGGLRIRGVGWKHRAQPLFLGVRHSVASEPGSDAPRCSLCLTLAQPGQATPNRDRETRFRLRRFTPPATRLFAVSSASTFRQAESSVIVEALRASAGRIAGKGGAAERHGLKRTTLQNKIRRLQISKSDYLDSNCVVANDASIFANF